MNKKTTLFGKTLATIRKARGMSQRDLAKAVGISHRMVAYYEAQTNRPPAEKLTAIANALHVSTDELLGNTTLKIAAPKNTRLWKKLRAVEKLPPKAQKQIINLVDLLSTPNGLE